MRIVRVVNKSRNAIVAERVIVAERWWERARGLLGQTGLPPEAGLLIVPCNSIHSVFMRFSFDALFLDQQRRVLHVIHTMPPFRFSRLVRGSWGVLELPAGVIAATETQAGDELTIEASS